MYVNLVAANRVKRGVIVVAGLLMVYALYVSRDHITHVAYLIGLTGYQAETLFVFIDLPAVIGKVLTLKIFAPSTRRLGWKLLAFTGLFSLAGNFTSGLVSGGWGPAGYGIFIVVSFMILENVVTKIKAALIEDAEPGTAGEAGTPVAATPVVETTPEVKADDAKAPNLSEKAPAATPAVVRRGPGRPRIADGEPMSRRTLDRRKAEPATA